MTSIVPPRDWTAIHWPDMAGSDPARWIAVLPLAATEQHGPHLPLGTDVMIGEAYLARVHELLPAKIPATFLPQQPVGISTEHIYYPGTLTLPAEIALKTWTALGQSLAYAGVKKLVLLSGRGEPEAERAEQMLQKCNVDWTILRCSFFSQNFSENFFLDPILAGEVALPVRPVAEPFVDIEDVAEPLSA